MGNSTGNTNKKKLRKQARMIKQNTEVEICRKERKRQHEKK